MGIPQGPCAELHCCAPETTVLTAAREMTAAEVGAICVIEQGRVIGLLSERDVMVHVVSSGRDPAKTLVREVMKPALVIDPALTIDDALRLMNNADVRHVPLVDRDGRPTAMLSLRRLLTYRLDQMRQENESLAAYVMADGIGG